MSDSYTDMPRWEELKVEAQSLKEVLGGFALVGVMDRDMNHIASMEEEIDRKNREALVAYWLSSEYGQLPHVIN